MIRLNSIPALLAALLAACGGAEAGNLARARTDTLPGGIIRVTSDGPTAWTEAAGATLVEESRFQGEDGTPSELGQPRSVAVDDWGRVYVVDAKPAVIKLFGPDGKFIRTIGREGEGPGEFRVGFVAVRGEHLVLHDPRIGRTSIFDTAGTFLRSWMSSCCYWSDIEIDRERRILIPSMAAPQKPDDKPRGSPYVRWSLEGKAIDTIWVPRREENVKYWSVSLKEGGKTVRAMMTPIPFMPGQVHTLHPGSGFVYGWTGEYQIVRSQSGSDSGMVFGRAWTPDPVTDERRAGEVESRVQQAGGDRWGEANLRDAFKLADVPTTLPAFEGLRVDRSGRVWVRRWPVSDTTRTFFDVFDASGAYLGPVTAPVRINAFGNQAWTGEGVVAAIEDEEGRPTIVRLKLAAAKDR
ncbi:MAG: 6-bladed beta-propeller [Gemmatimonadales bacterium]